MQIRDDENEVKHDQTNSEPVKTDEPKTDEGTETETDGDAGEGGDESVAA